MGGSGSIASLFMMGMSSSFINSFASAPAVVVLIVVFVGDVTVAVIGALGSFVDTPGGDATRRLVVDEHRVECILDGLWAVDGRTKRPLNGSRGRHAIC